HHVEELALSLDANKSGSQQVTVSVTGTLKDGSGNNIDIDKSYVVVVVLAWVGAATSSTLLAGPLSVGNGQQSSSIFLPGSNPSILRGSVSGVSPHFTD